VIATVVLVIVLNLRSTPATSATQLIQPANPVADSIPRQGTVLGTTGAPVKIDAWEDYQCPYCQVWTVQWEPHIIQDFVASGTVLYDFHDYAFLGAGHDPDESLAAAVAGQCANDQSKFWPYHDWLYANQNPNGEDQGWFTQARLDAIAVKVGLDQAAFDTCLVDPAKATAVKAEQAAGAALGINGTPSIFVNGKLQSLTTYDALATLIRSLAPATSSGSGAAPSSSAVTSPSPSVVASGSTAP
jgi:protein-disulfide isomerase